MGKLNVLYNFFFRIWFAAYFGFQYLNLKFGYAFKTTRTIYDFLHLPFHIEKNK